MNHHRHACPSITEPPRVQLSLDGVQESKSSSHSLDIYCIKFRGCKHVYPIKIVRACGKYKYDEQEEIRDVISDINEANIKITTGVFDKPKSSVMKCCKSRAATYPCEYCECPAVLYIGENMTKRLLTWPPTTMNGRPRTITAIRRIVNSIESQEEHLSKHYLKGIKGRSVLLNQPDFDYVEDSPTEYMHSVCLGLGKKMVEFTYKVGKQRHRVTKRKKCLPKLFNDLIISVKVPREIPRRCRNLDTSTLKAVEYRNILLFFFPIVVENIPQKYKKERQLWLALVFMIRSCVVPNEEFEHVKKDTIIKSCELFYNLFFELFGQRNCSYSVHIVPSHLLKIRGDCPLTERSAFKFESFYSEMKNLFNAGSNSPLKQILRNSIMKRKIEYHNCEKSILYKNQDNTKDTMEDNSLIYTFEQNKHELYVITEINGDVFTCKRHGKFKYKTPLLPTHDWNSVGVFRKGPIGDETFEVNRNQVKGKAISVQNMIITCPKNVLMEN